MLSADIRAEGVSGVPPFMDGMPVNKTQNNALITEINQHKILMVYYLFFPPGYKYIGLKGRKTDMLTSTCN